MLSRKSRPLIHNRCPPGYIKRSGFTRRANGKRIKSICVRGNVTTKKKYDICGNGMMLRSSYTRRYLGKNDLIKESSVSATCVHARKREKLPTDAHTLGSLKRGELKHFGYMYTLPERDRHYALITAIKSLGSLNVYRKLDAGAKLTNLTSHIASTIFATDRDWIRSKYVLL